MRLVLPISSVDYELATALAVRLRDFGTFKDRKICVAVCWSDKWDAEIAIDILEEAARSVQVFVLPDPPKGGKWPDAANHMFYETAIALQRCSNKEPFYWFEADCFPITPNFMGTLEQEYKKAARPYMGIIWPTRYDTPNGQIEKGKHMVGAGVYPADFLTRCETVHYIPEHMPWDVWIQNEVVDSCYPTPVMYHGWGCGRYKIIDGLLIGEDLGDRTGKENNGGRPVPRETVTIHGSKDRSLFSIDFSQWIA